MLPIFILIISLLGSSNTLPLDDFFPFGAQVSDSTMAANDDDSVGPLHLPYSFPYFDNNHRQIWVANNGLFSFLSAISQFTPDPFPLANGQRLVTGFWADIDTRGTVTNGNKVYYQIYSNTSPSNTTLVVFTKSSDYVRRFFPQQRPFEPTMAITGTWYRVGAYSGKVDRLNTFQIVLATDGDRSFVFILYHDLQWAGPGYTTEPYAQAGFNAGDGVAFEMLPYSRTSNVVRLVNESNVNVPGLFVFRVDTDAIDAGGCSGNVSAAAFRPRISSQLGSTALLIQGPCYTNDTMPKCRFGASSQDVDGIVIDQFRAICLTPLALTHGPVPVTFSTDNGNTFISAGTFTYAPLQFGSDDVIIETNNVDNLLTVGQNVNLTWRFSDVTKDTFPNGTKLTIELWRVSLNNQLQLQVDNSPVILTQNIDASDRWVYLRMPEAIRQIETCFIRVVAHFESKTYAGLNTGVLIIRSPLSYAPELCIDWSRRQPAPTTWNGDGLLPCPMTRTQAIAAGRCCYDSDSQCYQGSTNPSNCWLHQGRPAHNEQTAVECYLSKSFNVHGAGTECCYERNGALITRGTGAGTDNRHHHVRSPVQHFFDDTLPYLHCCIMSTNPEMCNTYMRHRPPRRGSNTMGENGGMWGDPHLTTLDGTSYTFNGHGEYVYLAITNDASPPAAFNPSSQSYTFMSQIRTVPIASTGVTVTKAFSARSFGPDTQPISITVSRREQLVIRRGSETLEFEDDINTLFFPEMTIEKSMEDSKILILSWNVGVTIQINLIDMTLPSPALVLNVAASVAGIFRHRTYGLLGTYDGQATNDLRAENGNIVDNSATTEQIHREFGVTWAIHPDTSLFHYDSDQSAVYFQEQNRIFVPTFVEPSNAPAEDASYRQACKIDAASAPSTWTIAQRTCYYDISVTKDEAFGKTSLDAADELLIIKANQRNPPAFDNTLPITMQAKASDKIRLILNASSEYPSNVIQLSAEHLPSGATFNDRTGEFNWKAVKGEDYVKISARDTTYGLTATLEIDFQVESKSRGAANQIELQIFLFIISALCAFLFK